MNDPVDTSALAGAVIDLETGSTFVSVEAERRIGRSFILEAQACILLNIDQEDPAKSIEDDDFVTISLQYHF